MSEQTEPLTELDRIARRADQATGGPWERGDVWRWAAVIFDDGDCFLCAGLGEPAWQGRADINGERVLAHKHRDLRPWGSDHIISAPDGLVAGNYDQEEGGIINPADAEFIAHAREDVPRLVAEVRGLRAVNERLTEEHEAQRRAIDIIDHLADQQVTVAGRPWREFMADAASALRRQPEGTSPRTVTDEEDSQC